MLDLVAPDGKIILEHFEAETPSGLSVGEDKGEPRMGIVFGFGKPLEKDPQIKLTVGQKVCIKKYVSNPLYIPQLNKRFIFVDYDDITAILVEKKSE